MNFHFELSCNSIFFIYDTFMFSTSSQHGVSITLYGIMFNKKFQNKNSDEHDENETIGEKISEKFDENENIIFGDIQQ
ncbi:MAG: hypothetical protein IIA82_03855 [Thaumarchaeota archaeon]|nr:hypothetical protein [Nitrososphaerota archaeon]